MMDRGCQMSWNLVKHLEYCFLKNIGGESSNHPNNHSGYCFRKTSIGCRIMDNLIHNSRYCFWKDKF